MARSDTTKSSTPKETEVAQSKALTVVETTKVPFLERVKLVPVERKTAPRDADPVVQARANVIAGIEKQLNALSGNPPKSTSFKRKGKSGVEKEVTREWTPWYSQRGPIWVTEIKYGQKSILLGEDGKPVRSRSRRKPGRAHQFLYGAEGVRVGRRARRADHEGPRGSDGVEGQIHRVTKRGLRLPFLFLSLWYA